MYSSNHANGSFKIPMVLDSSLQDFLIRLENIINDITETTQSQITAIYKSTLYTFFPVFRLRIKTATIRLRTNCPGTVTRTAKILFRNAIQKNRHQILLLKYLLNIFSKITYSNKCIFRTWHNAIIWLVQYKYS